MKICMDPGHGGNDPGASGYGYNEKDIVLEAALYIGGRLKALGAEVQYTRTADVNPGEPQDRGRMAKGCDYFLSLHCNGSKSPTAHGSEVWCSGGEAFAQTESRFAEYLGKLVAWRGIKSKSYATGEEFTRPYDSRRMFTETFSFTDWYGVLRGAASVGVSADLLEMFFIANRSDLDCYLGHKREFWEGIVRAVCESFGIGYIAPDDADPPAAETVPRSEHEELWALYESERALRIAAEEERDRYRQLYFRLHDGVSALLEGSN